MASPGTSGPPRGEALRELRTSVSSLQRVDAELRRRVDEINPLTYGLPDLLRPPAPGEDAAAFRARQNRELRAFAETHLSVLKDGTRRPMRLTSKMVEFVSDMFYRRVPLAIVWKGRGSGGSVCAALLIWLSVVYHRMSFTNMAGAEEQAKVIYRYTTDFWGCFPDLARGLLDDKPLTTETRLKSGTVIKTISASEKQARGKHNPGFVVDESCQDVEGVDRLIQAAMQNSMSEANHMVVLISTFHHPVGLFQECVLPGEMVQTAEGWVPIEQIQPEDEVLAADGRLHTVRDARSKLFDGEAVRIVARGFGRGIRVTTDHKMLVREGAGVAWREAGKLGRGDFLAFPRPRQMGGHPGEIRLPRRVWNKTAESGCAWLTVPLTEDFYRWLGYWLGDGSQSDRLVVLANGQGDAWWWEDYDALVRGLFQRSVTVSVGNEGRRIERSFGFRGLSAWLRGECRGSDGEKRIPLWLLERASDAELTALLVGLLRTDGHLREHSLNLSSVSPSIAAGAYWAMVRLGLVPSIHVDEGAESKIVCGVECRAKPLWSLDLCDGSASGLVKAAFLDDVEWGAARNCAVSAEWIFAEVRSVDRRPYVGPVWDLGVEGEHSFCLPWATAHNCWDFAEERGFKRYSWDAIDSMERCTAGLNTATPEDPRAQGYCRSECPLTWRRSVVDVNGVPIGEAWQGCDARAREGEGFLPRNALLTAQRMNRGTSVFEVEYLNGRPDWMRPVYDSAWIERAFVDDAWPPPGSRVVEKSIGIDWGLEGQTAIVLTALIDVPTGAVAPPGGGLPAEPPFRRCVGVLDVRYMTGKLTPEAIKVLWEWAGQFGQDKFYVYADASHPFNNLEVDQAGLDLSPVGFAKWKDYGIGNVTKFFTTPGRFYLRRSLDGLVEQLKRYRLDRQGRPIKRDDHGPDALLSFLDPKIRIMTPRGWVPVGKLRVGDDVLTHRGRFRPITRYEPAPYQRGQVVLNVRGRRHPVDAFRTTLEHPYLRADGRWVNAEHVRPGDHLMFLATRCVECDKKIPFFKKSCDECAGKVRNARWKSPGDREEKERRRKRKQLLREYATGKRDAATNVAAATAARAKQIREDPEERDRVRAHLRSLLPLVNTPAKRRRQAALMKRLSLMSDPIIRERVTAKVRAYCRRPEVRAKRSRLAIARMEALKRLPFPERMGRKTGIEAAVGRVLREIGVRARHNYKIGRYWVDWAIPSRRLAIECDGEYWHRRYELLNPGRDARRDEYLREKGWTTIRLSERRIRRDVGSCRDEIVRVLANHADAYEFAAVEVASVKIKPMPKPRTAYHFEVADDHSYVARGIVSHNCALLRFRFEDLFAADLEVAEAPLPPGVMLLPRRVEPKFDGVAPPTTAPPSGLPPRPIEPIPRKKVAGDGQVIVL